MNAYSQGIVIDNPGQFLDDFLNMKNDSCNAFHSIDSEFMKDFFDRPVVYFLMHNGMIVYIGQKKHLLKRITEHWDKGHKQFDGFKWIFTNTIENAIIVEGALIGALHPKYNKTNGDQAERLAEKTGVCADIIRREYLTTRRIKVDTGDDK